MSLPNTTIKYSTKLNAYERAACAKRATPADEQKVRDLIAAGNTQAQVAAELGFCRATVTRITRKWRISRPTGRPKNS